MVSTSGSQLLPREAIRELRELLLPQATVLTPNVPEARLLLSSAGKPVHDPQNVDDMIDLAKAVQSLGPKFVLVKGGHLPFKKDGTVAATEAERELMIDILYGEGQVTKIEAKYQLSRNTHGTGCSLACKCNTSSLAQ
jgi:hydroxymethylpyrimidine kinase/phosphomethylpyrimidine kinase